MCTGTAILPTPGADTIVTGVARRDLIWAFVRVPEAVNSDPPPPASGCDDQLVPSLVRTLPDVPAKSGNVAVVGTQFVPSARKILPVPVAVDG
jgi:hypothetical protein